MNLKFWRSKEIARAYPFDLGQFLFNGLTYPLYGANVTTGEKQELPDNNFVGYVQAFYYSNPVVFACQCVRESLFSEARFQFRQIRQGRPGDLFGTEALAILEEPWPNGTTGDLLTRMEQDSSIAGNFFATVVSGYIRRMRPDWVTIVLGSRTDPEVRSYDLDAEILGYLYHPGGLNSGEDPIPLLRETVCHYAPRPDPLACYRGMSWMTPVVREILSDNAATTHKTKYFEEGAGRKLAIKMNPETQVEAAKKWIEVFKQEHEGVVNRFKTMFLGGGMDPVVVGATLEESSFKDVQGAGETRIAAAAQVPPVIVGLSEGLQGSSLNAGNYSASRRRFADGTMRPLWRNAAASLATLVNVPGGSELWYDDRDIPFLREDEKDVAETQFIQSQAMRQLTDGGWRADTVRDAILSGDFSKLEHTDLFSVQLQPPGSVPVNGNGQKPAMRMLAEALTELAKE
jgi:hypothetical protein